MGDHNVAAELFIRLIIGVDSVFAASGNPRGCRLDAEMVVLVPRQTALSVAAFQYALRQCDGSRNAIPAHLCHRIIRVLQCIFLILAHNRHSLSMNTPMCFLLVLPFIL